MARSLAGPAQGGRRPGLEGGGPKTGKVATNPGVGSGPNLGTTRSWSNAARKLEKRGSRQRPAAADDWKNQYLSIISIVLKTACPSTPRSAAPGCLFCRRPLTRRLPGPPASAGCPAGRSFPPASREFLPADADPPSHWLPRRSPPPLPVAAPAAPSRRSLGSSSPPTPTRRPTGCPVGRSFPPDSREFLSADTDPSPPGATGFDWLPRRSLLPVGLSGAPPRRRRPAASRGHRFRLVAPPVAAASAGCCAGRSFPSASREFLSADTDPSPPGATGFDRLLRRSLLPAGHSH